ncbi:MAG TPA: polyprenyl synthetase family protein [Actinomycetota bacterium]
MARPLAEIREQLAGIEADVRAGIERVEAALRDAVATADPFVQEAAGYLVRAGGKRFRPTLVLLSAHLGDPTRPKVIGAAAAIELTHLSTLYHDDVMDEAEVRRGARSANARYDNKIAILTGDYLFARASELTADLGTEPTRILAHAITRLVQGQIRDVRGPLEGQDPVDHYLGVLTDKTGALIAAACRLGAQLAGAPDGIVKALTEYGERIGVAFQLGDDLLDITAETSVAGKQPGTDLRAGLRTLPVLYLLRAGGPDADRLATLLHHPDQPGSATVEEALALLRGSPALAEARKAAEAEVARAKAALTPLPEGPARLALEAVADQVFDRDV